MARSREQEREKFRRRMDWPNKSQCEAKTSKRRGQRQCPWMGYYDPIEGGHRCQIHEAR